MTTATVEGTGPTPFRDSIVAKYLRRGVPRRDLGILPLVLVLPFAYVPKILEGDTQPWVLIASLFALVTFRTDTLVRRDDYPLFGLGVLCATVYALRSPLDLGLLRQIYTQAAFLILWIITGRERGDYFPGAVRLTIVIWFVVGIVQWTFVRLGIPIDFAGRFVEGRGGIPSLTPEASYYGSLSVLQMMYLMSRRRAENALFVVMAGLSVLLSGSVLAILLLIFPLTKLGWRMGALAVLLAAVALTAEYAFGLGGIEQTLGRFDVQESLLNVFSDPSLNLRVGHIFFTLYEHVWDSLTFATSIDFMNQYNSFARRGGLFIDTGSNFILPAAGELVYSSGVFGLALIYAVIRRALAASVSRSAKVEKLILILVCLLNPIPLSNPFLVMYAQKDS